MLCFHFVRYPDQMKKLNCPHLPTMTRFGHKERESPFWVRLLCGTQLEREECSLKDTLIVANDSPPSQDQPLDNQTETVQQKYTMQYLQHAYKCKRITSAGHLWV